MADEGKTNVFDRGKYWAGRKHLVYYSVIDRYVRYVGRNAKTLLDVGGTAPYIEWFDWIPTLMTLDIAQPYQSDRVVGLKTDFYEYQPEKKFDIVLCLQVLEHLDDPKKAVDKIKQITDTAIISVPYKWDPRITAKSGHIQDPVDEKKLDSWVGQAPVVKTVVNEPFMPQWPRLVAWYHFGEKPPVVDFEEYKRRQRDLPTSSA